MLSRALAEYLGQRPCMYGQTRRGSPLQETDARLAQPGGDDGRVFALQG